MHYATIFQADAKMAFFRGDVRAVAEQLIRQNAYKKIGTVATELEGQAAAEEMFDLSNNPSREHERELVWGANPSLSVGDVVFVDGRAWLCDSVGWVELS